MKRSCLLKCSIATLTLTVFTAASNAQQGNVTRGDGPDTLPDSPQVPGTGPQRFRVVPIKGFSSVRACVSAERRHSGC
jgi:hypothetical protein